MPDRPDWTRAIHVKDGTINVTGGTVTVTHVTTVDNITTIAGAKTVEVINKATTVIQTGNRHDLLDTFNTTRAVETVHYIAPAKLLATYGAIVVEASTGSSTHIGTLLCVQISQLGTTIDRLYVSSAFGPSITGTQVQCVVPASVQRTGGTLQVVVYAASATATTSVRTTIYGLTSNPGVLLRSDGRAYPVGRFRADFHGNGAAITAPASPLRVLLVSARLSVAKSTTTSVEWVVKGTLGGTASGLIDFVAYTKGTVSIGADVPPCGLLLDPATAVNVTHSVARGTAHTVVAYDLVA